MNIRPRSDEHLYIKQPGATGINVVDILTDTNTGKIYVQGIGGYQGTTTAGTQDLATYLAMLPDPMVNKGTIGTGGTIEWNALPAASASTLGFTYKVITNHSTAPVCKAGDMISCYEISTGSYGWMVIPSGDEPSGTVTNVGTTGDITTVNVTINGVSQPDGSAIMDSGVIKHANVTRSNTTSSVSPTAGGTFTVVDSITTSDTGHVTGINTKTVTLPVDPDTKNTAGSTNSTSKLFLIGATAQSDNPQTYSNSKVYEINGVLTSEDSIRVSNSGNTAGGNMRYDATEKCIKFSFS